MRYRLARLSVVVVLLWLVAAWAALWPWPVAGEEKEKRLIEQNKWHRLPPYYAHVVRPAQRAAIYDIQARHGAEIDAILAKRDAEVQAVLTAEQADRVEEIKAEAKILAVRAAELRDKIWAIRAAAEEQGELQAAPAVDTLSRIEQRLRRLRGEDAR